jgi:hypothetical protein
MTQDEIIRMAVECQLLTTSPRDGLYAQALEAFAKLVAAKEREACAKIAENRLLTEASDIEKIAHYTACKNIASGIRAREQS